MMAEPAILATLTTIFQDVFDDPALVVTAETTADDVPGWDSFNHIMLVVAVERAFAMKFATAEIEALKNVGDLVRLIARRSPGRP